MNKRRREVLREALTLLVTVRGLDQDLLAGPPTQHTQTHTSSGREAVGVKKAEGHVGGERGTRQHLQSPLLIALLPAWSQITGLERLQSGLYLLANLSPPQIRTSKPPSYHLLVNLQQWKGHRDTVKLNSFSASLFLCVENALGGSYTHHSFSVLGRVQGTFSSPSCL